MDGKITFMSDSQGSIRIEIEDKSSGLMFFVAEMTAEDFGRGITGLACRPIKYKMGGLKNVGKQEEIKTVSIPYQWKLGNNFVSEMKELVKPYEIDGWEADIDQSFNHHYNKNGKYKVTFRRYL